MVSMCCVEVKSEVARMNRAVLKLFSANFVQRSGNTSRFPVRLLFGLNT